MTAIMLVDDHAVVRAGLCLLLESQPDISVVTEASSADEALRLPLGQDPELIVTDLSMQGLRGAAVGALLAARAATPRIHGNPIAALSEREREVLDLLVLGHTNVEIAALIFLSPRTVETHRANIQRKLGVKSRADLVRFASQRGH